VSETAQVTRAAGVVGGATLLSRILGYVRDVVVAWYFGAGVSADAFFVAFRIPNLLRRLLAEGSLTMAFVPVFSECLAKEGEKEAFSMAGATFRLLALVLIVTTVLGMLLAPWIVRIVAPGFARTADKLALTAGLTRIMFPYIFFVGLVALSMGILNVLRHFAAPALSPMLLNAAMILSVLLLAPLFPVPVTALGVGVLIGGALQLALQVPFLMRKGVFFWKEKRLFHPAIRQVARLMGPTILGSAVYQVNILVGTFLASLLAQGSVAYLYYADRLVEFPLGIFGIATATAVLPTLSRQAGANDMEGLRESFVFAMRLVFFITVPATVGLVVLREPMVSLLFQRGAFDPQTTRMTAVAVLYYGIGLCAFSAVRIVVSVFYALQDTVTPVKMAIWAMGANIVLSVALMGPLEHGGLALATSAASMINVGLLAWHLRRRLGSFGGCRIAASFVRSCAAALAMGAGIWVMALQLLPSGAGSPSQLLWGLGVCIVAGILAYSGFSAAFNRREMAAVAAAVRGRTGRV